MENILTAAPGDLIISAIYSISAIDPKTSV